MGLGVMKLVYEKMAKILAEIVGIDSEDIRPETELTREYGITAIDVAKLVIECEKAFKIIIHDEDVHNFRCVKDLVKYVKKAHAD